MAKKLYTSGNYIIADDDAGNVIRMPKGGAFLVDELPANFTVNHANLDLIISIPKADFAQWEDAESGGAAYASQAAMEQFFEDNTGNFSPASGGSGAGDEYTYTEVAVSSAQILSMGTSPVQLLPSAGVGNYHDVQKVIIENILVTTNYTSLQNIVVKFGFSGIGQVYQDFLNEGAAAIFVNFVNEFGSTDANKGEIGSRFTFDSLLLTTAGGANPTGGDHTILAKIWHKTRTIGTEL